MSTLMNLVTSWLAYFGSGRTSRFGISLRLGTFYLNVPFSMLIRRSYRGHQKLLLRRLRPLGAVLGAALLAILHPRGVEAAAHHVIAHTRQIFYAPTADQHHRVLLQV